MKVISDRRSITPGVTLTVRCGAQTPVRAAQAQAPTRTYVSKSISADSLAQLLNAALSVRQLAYAPYSSFRVGAAALSADGLLFSGVNVENASYGLTCCAERAALFSAVASGQRSIIALAIASEGGVAPCGACRQVIAELANAADIYLVDALRPEAVQTFSIDELLPHQFSRAALDRGS